MERRRGVGVRTVVRAGNFWVSQLLTSCAAPRVAASANVPSLLRVLFSSRPTLRGAGRHALSPASTPGDPPGRGNRACRYHWPVLLIMSTRQTQGALAGDPTADVEAGRGRPQQTHWLQSVKNPSYQDPQTVGPAVPRGLASVRGGAPALKQLVSRRVDRGGKRACGLHRGGFDGGAGPEGLRPRLPLCLPSFCCAASLRGNSGPLVLGWSGAARVPVQGGAARAAHASRLPDLGVGGEEGVIARRALSLVARRVRLARGPRGLGIPRGSSGWRAHLITRTVSQPAAVAM